MIKLVIFDYDGVIVDSFPKVHEVYMEICKQLGKECPAEFDNFKKVYGKHSGEAYANLKISSEEVRRADEIFSKEILNKKPKLFEGIKEVLEELNKKYVLILISSNLKEEINQKLERFGINQYFKEIIARTPREVGVRSRGKDLDIINAMKKYGFSEKETVIIGDREVDYNAGKRAGLNNILLVEYGWGYHKEELHGHDQKVIINEPSQILTAIEDIK